MDEPKINETDVHDLSLGVIHALALVNVKALSYVQLRRLYAALTHAREDVKIETERRAQDVGSKDTVRVAARGKKKN